MQSNLNLMKTVAQEFKLPVIGDGSRVWFFRTQSGLYYFDFFVNQFIALGWDLIPVSLIQNKSKNNDDKKDEISDLYPDEKRPGLILSQMDTFYNKMQVGELVVIPAAGGKKVAIGILGDIVSEIKHKNPSEEYEKCEYTHRRAVKWLKQIDLWTDVYLLKVLRAQQTISDITEYAEMVYRNLHPCYVSEDGMHITLQKTSEAEYRIKDNIALQSAVLQIHSSLAEYYGEPDESDKIVIKTAVGSPGFIEIILPFVPCSAITAILIYRGIVGKLKSSSGEESTGLMAILSKGNELLNDHYSRKKTDAETKQIQANTALIEAQTRKTIAEADSVEIANERERLAVANIVESTKTLRTATKQSGIGFEKQLEEVS